MSQAGRRWSARENSAHSDEQPPTVAPERLRNLKLSRTVERHPLVLLKTARLFSRFKRSSATGTAPHYSTEGDDGHDLRYLRERPWPPLDAELRVAELAVAGVGGRQPLLQAALVHRAQRARAVARGQQPLADASFVANAADGAIAGGGGHVERKEKNQKRFGR